MNKIIISVIFLLTAVTVNGQENQKRNRGESFYNLCNSNTVGYGNIWLTIKGVGHVWDDDPVTLDSTRKVDKKWISNVRGFPEIKIEGGLLEFVSASIESRLLSYGFRPGYVSCGVKMTTPDNSDLRLNGFGLQLSYIYQFMESSPTLGGYSGFMPEGFVVKGSSIEMKFLYELDLLARFSKMPLRLIANLGTRIPLRKNRLNCFQILGNSGLVYSGYGYDFYTMFVIEAFNNLLRPLKIQEPDDKTIAVYFRENPMYIVLGGNVRYDNGCVLNVSIPLLVSKNRESKMNVKDLIELHRNSNTLLFKDEKERGIKDPFDPWFVKWEIVCSFTFPIKYKMTSAEMMRNYLLLKNRKKKKNMNIDQKIQDEESNMRQQDDNKRRLEEIKRRKEEILNSK